ncbi:bifunctional nuclease family protein [Acidianus sulfidivorans JP7]|uniref:BFN domain-containing protein n=1 Tax=Acidianus sulfidivorans JP7 TaxID=619593 RepID=A0A2U9IME8_9CREN|nr:bifunctional nuclease domain-containing protein [Acidianus sulfidivorans]AWR97193.1 bifunctional nuclease family protein [Acidianus sulfidivorans JP7]
MSEEEKGYIKVNKVDAFIYPLDGLPVMVCYLDDGREFNLFYVPVEIVIAINKLKKQVEEDNILNDKRENVFDILAFIPEITEELNKHINKVIIDDISGSLYIATIELKFDGVIIQKRMIPSHAIYLALIANKPIYVRKSLVDEQEKERKQGEGENK